MSQNSRGSFSCASRPPREGGVFFVIDAADDGFYSEANQRYLEKMVALDKECKLHYVTKTIEELEVMAR